MHHSATMKSDIDDHTHLLQDMDQSVGALTAGFREMQLRVSEALDKLDMVWKYMPPTMGYCWGPEAPILLLDGLGREISLPILLVRTPDVMKNLQRLKGMSILDAKLIAASLIRISATYSSLCMRKAQALTRSRTGNM